MVAKTQIFKKRCIDIFDVTIMKKFLKIFLIAVALLSVAGSILCLSLSRMDDIELKEGDLLFQISKSAQSPLIALATGSVYTHCGILVEKQGEWYVLEATGPVKLTPLQQWCDKGRFKHVISRRVLEKPVKVRYKQYLGQAYDWSFKFDNGKMYCSELIYEIYKKQFGIELSQPRKIGDFNLLGMRKVMKRRGMGKDQLAVAPSDLMRSEYLLD